MTKHTVQVHRMICRNLEKLRKRIGCHALATCVTAELAVSLLVALLARKTHVLVSDIEHLRDLHGGCEGKWTVEDE